MSNRWKKEEIEYLIKHYDKISSTVLAKKFGKTPSAVQSKAWKMGLNSGRETQKDEELLEYVSYGFKPYQIANIMGMNEERVKTIIRGHS